MTASIYDKHSVYFLIGIPTLLLALSFLFPTTSNDVQQEKSATDYNSYLEQMPEKYANLFNTMKENDSTFFCSIVEENAIREIVVFKLYPNNIEAAADFIVKVFPFNSKLNEMEKNIVTLELVNNATLFNHNGKTYGVYKKTLPFIKIEKLGIERIRTSRIQSPWNSVIEKPFLTPNKDFKIARLGANTFQTNPNPYVFVLTEALKTSDISYLPYSYTIINDSLFQVNTTIGDYISKEKRTIGKVENPNQFWDMVNKKNNLLSGQIKFIGENSEDAGKLIEGYLHKNFELESVFDLKKLAKIAAIKNVFSNSCNENIYFLYNENSNLIEPFFTSSECLGQRSKYVRKSDIDNVGYLHIYIKELDKISEINFYEDLIKNNHSFQKELSFINNYYPENIFDLDLISINQNVIKKSLDISALIKTEVINVSNEKMTVSILNFSSYPIDINNLRYKKNKNITTLNPKIKILSGMRDTIIIDLPRSFENLFVSKKKRATGFLLHKHIYDLYLGYSMSGIDKTYFSTIIPYQAKQKIEEDLFRTKSSIENREDIVVNLKEKIISFDKQKIIISSPLIIPSGFEFKVKAGTIIDIVNGGKIISYAPLNFIGTKQDPIKIFSSDEKGQGVLVLSGGMQSELKHVFFNHLTNPKHGYWGITGAVTFYESPVNLKNVSIKNNRCEDALNIVRTTFTMKNCTISDTQSDAFDGDFVTGIISTSTFDNLGNDAIDVSGSDLKISNVQISNAGDKGLSAGEDSQITVSNVNISSSEIGVAGKDLSNVTIKDLKIIDTKLGFTAFQKKPEFGPSNITVTGLIMEGVETKYLVESSSSLFIDGGKIKTSKNVKDRMYGVEFGRSSEETRNSQ